MPLPDVHYGSPEEKPVDWRQYEDGPPDTDDVLEETDPSVVALLGFDPLELEGE